MTEHIEVFIKFDPPSDSLREVLKSTALAGGATWLDHDSPSAQFVREAHIDLAEAMRDTLELARQCQVRHISFRKVNHH